MTPEQTEIKALKEELNRLKADAVSLAVHQAEKERLEQEYQRSQDRYRTVFEQSAVGKKIINDKLEIIKVNQALLKIIGIPNRRYWDGGSQSSHTPSLYAIGRSFKSEFGIPTCHHLILRLV